MPRDLLLYIEKDLNVERQQDKKAMLQLKKEIKNLSTTHRVTVINDKIKIGSKWFRWNKDKKLVCDEHDAAVIFKDLFENSYTKININYNALLSNIMSKN